MKKISILLISLLLLVGCGNDSGMANGVAADMDYATEEAVAESKEFGAVMEDDPQDMANESNFPSFAAS